MASSSIKTYIPADIDNGTYMIVVEFHAGNGFARGHYDFINKHSPKNITVNSVGFFGNNLPTIALSSIRYEKPSNGCVLFYTDDVNAVTYANQFPIRLNITVT